MWYTNGQQSVIVRVKLRQDTTASKPGDGITGLSNMTGGLNISTIADNEAVAMAYSGSHIGTIATLGAYVAPAANSCNFREVDSTNHPGLYEIQFLNTRFNVAGARSLRLTISGVAGMIEYDEIFLLSVVNPYDGAFGMANLDQKISTRMATFSLPGNFAALLISSEGHISNVDTLTTYTNDTPQSGDNFARLGSPTNASVSADIAAVKAAIPTFPSNFGSMMIDSTGHVQIQGGLGKNVAMLNFEFLMTDTSGNELPSLALTGSSAITAQCSIDGGAWTNCTNTQNIKANIGNGVYAIDLSAADRNGDRITYKFSASGAQDTIIYMPTMP